MNIRKGFLLVFASFLFSGCAGDPKAEDLYGQWKYVKVEMPRQDPPALSDEKIREEAPFITFTSQKDLVIMWGGKRLSYGKFKMDKDMIRYKENLEGGKTREFPFLIKKITEKELIFETMEADFTRVTALREK